MTAALVGPGGQIDVSDRPARLLGVGVNNITRQVLLAWVPAGSSVLLSTSGDGAGTIVGQVELVFG
jgi:hypothetical protein